MATADTRSAGESTADAAWAARIAAHRDRRPDHWSTEEIGKAPEELVALIGRRRPDDTLLVDDIGGWLSALLETAPAGDQARPRHRAAVTALVAPSRRRRPAS